MVSTIDMLQVRPGEPVYAQVCSHNNRQKHFKAFQKQTETQKLEDNVLADKIKSKTFQKQVRWHNNSKSSSN